MMKMTTETVGLAKGLIEPVTDRVKRKIPSSSIIYLMATE